jgi:hypothetical protein
MALYIGNPTNVVVSEAYKISFITYSAWMLLPTVVCILLAYIVLRILFHGDYYLPRHIQPPDADPKSVLIDPQGAIFGLVLLGCCLATLVGTSFASVPVWMITLPFAFVMFLRDVRHDLGISFSRVFNIKKRYPRPVLNTTSHDEALVAYAPSVREHAKEGGDIQLDTLSTSPSINLPTPETDDEGKAAKNLETSTSVIDIGTAKLSSLESITTPSIHRKKSYQSLAVVAPEGEKDIDDLGSQLRFRSITPLESQTNTPISEILRSTSFAAASTTASSTMKVPTNKSIKPFYRAYKWFGTRFPTLKAVFMRMPWSILPFSLGMFILIEALAELGWVGIFATAMAVFAKNYATAVLGMVFVSILACQLLNNLVSRALIL